MNLKNSSSKSTNKNIKHVAVIMDAWFPRGHQPGVVGGGQVHVRELTKQLSNKYPVKFTYFYPAHPHIIYRTLWTFIAMVRVYQLHRQHHFDLLHSHGFNSGVICHYMGKWLHLPTIHTVHGSHLMDLKSKSIKAKLEKWVLTQLHYSAQITVANTFTKYPNHNQSIHVIPNGVDTDVFDEIEVEKNTSPTIIWVGRDDPMKGLSYLREAILKVRKKVPDLKTKLITGGHVTGKALIKAYKQSHLFVLPSIAEGQPITLLEAWAAKLPVVVTNVGDNSTMVKDGVNGYLVEPKNVVQLANAIMKILRARTKDKQMGEAGYRLVKKEYSWDKVAAQTWSVYSKVMNSE